MYFTYWTLHIYIQPLQHIRLKWFFFFCNKTERFRHFGVKIVNLREQRFNELAKLTDSTVLGNVLIFVVVVVSALILISSFILILYNDFVIILMALNLIRIKFINHFSLPSNFLSKYSPGFQSYRTVCWKLNDRMFNASISFFYISVRFGLVLPECHMVHIF